jgi:DNA-binding transcriptional LysR family regulator
MHAPRLELPPLDLLRGFEAAARHLSFTRAAAELSLTQSAISRQVQMLEESIGVPLFQRRHRALLLTDAGQVLYRKVAGMMDELRGTMRELRGAAPLRPLTVTMSVSFASLWLIPRLPSFRSRHPGVDVRIVADNQLLDLSRDTIEVAIRYCAPDAAPANAVLLFGEEVLPVCSPRLLRDGARPLRAPEDLRHHMLLHDEWNWRGIGWLDWDSWLEAHGLAKLKPAGDLHFSHYYQMVQAAIECQGVALGRLPLLSEMIRRRHLVAPFEGLGSAVATPRAFFMLREPRSAAREEVSAFCDWLVAQARGESVRAPSGQDPAPRRLRATRRRQRL